MRTSAGMSDQPCARSSASAAILAASDSAITASAMRGQQAAQAVGAGGDQACDQRHGAVDQRLLP
jgi:hypothetical protein